MMGRVNLGPDSEKSPEKDRMKLIFDLGANTGDNLEYYLLKAEKVVAVEANPALVQALSQRFSAEIKEGQLTVIGKAISDELSEKAVEFHVNLDDSGHSSLVGPDGSGDRWESVFVETTTIAELVSLFGVPDYVKIDLEGLDAKILRSMFLAGITPRYVSAEAHDPAILGMLDGFGCYQSFSFIEGSGLSAKFRGFRVTTKSGTQERIDFSEMSAGPCADDLPGPWYSSSNAHKFLALRGPGWFDIHASMERPSEEEVDFALRDLFNISARRMLNDQQNEVLRSLRNPFRRRVWKKPASSKS